MSFKIFEYDPSLLPYDADIELRMDNYAKKKSELCGEGDSLLPLSCAHEYFGFHKVAGGWVYREWAPAADNVYITGDFCYWDMTAHKLTRLDGGVFEIFLDVTGNIADFIKSH